MNIETLYNPSEEISQIIERGLHEHNLSVLGPEVIYNYAKFAVVSRDDAGQVTGGLLGAFIWGVLKIDVLWVSADQRGQDVGTRMLAQAEAEARQRGGIQLILLETTSFQARAFYEKNGFEVYGQLDDYPKGHTWYHMRKMILYAR